MKVINCKFVLAMIMIIAGLTACSDSASDAEQVSAENMFSTVNEENLVQVEFIAQSKRLLERSGGINKFFTWRKPTEIDKQTIIRMNRDTLYMMGVFDISQDVTITAPDVGDRYMTFMPINEHGYVNTVFYGSGKHTFTKDQIGSNYMFLLVRIFVDAASEEDVKAVNALQDQITVNAPSNIAYDPPAYNEDDYKKFYKKMVAASANIADATHCFGAKDDVIPKKFRICAIIGFAGLPTQYAFYDNVFPKLPVGEYQLTVKDVPVRAFWSISLYNADGYFEKNDLGAYNMNSVTSKPNPDGSITVHFGGCEDKRPNCLPITKGWNYVVRMYEPDPAIINYKWRFPASNPTKKMALKQIKRRWFNTKKGHLQGGFFIFFLYCIFVNL